LIEIDGMKLPVVGREALVKNKRATGRPKGVVDTDVPEQEQPR
jgi:hypothetical protein